MPVNPSIVYINAKWYGFTLCGDHVCYIINTMKYDGLFDDITEDDSDFVSLGIHMKDDLKQHVFCRGLFKRVLQRFLVKFIPFVITYDDDVITTGNYCYGTGESPNVEKWDPPGNQLHGEELGYFDWRAFSPEV